LRIGDPLPRFPGKERDTDNGVNLDFFHARYHGSAQGRFLSPDPLGIMVADPTNPQSWNMYAYVQNSPLINIDPSGTTCLDSNGNVTNPDDPKGVGDNGDGLGCSAAGVAPGNPNDYSTLNPNDYVNETVQSQEPALFDYIYGLLTNDIPIYVPNLLLRYHIVPKVSILAPIPGTGPFGLPLLGVQFDVTYIPSTKQLCGSLGLAFSPTGAIGANATAYLDPLNAAPKIVPGFSAGITMQPNFTAGVAATGSAGQPVIAGPTVGFRGVSVNSGYGKCTAAR